MLQSLFEYFWPSNGFDTTSEPRVGSISSDVINAEWKIGAFEIHWTSTPDLQLEVIETRTGKVAWSSVPNTAFVSTGLCPTEVEHFYFGMQVTNPRYTTTATHQTVNSITFNDDQTSSLDIKGTLKLSNDNVVQYLMSFSKTECSSRLAFKASIISNESLNKCILHYSTDESEKIFGFGQQFPLEFDLKGRRVPIIVSEQGVGRGLQPLTWFLNTFKEYAGGTDLSTYCAMPLYMKTGSEKSAFFLENREFSVFDLSSRSHVQVEVSSLNAVGQIVTGDTPLELVKNVTNFTGRMPQLPEWISDGALVGTQGGRKFVEELHSTLKTAEVPISGFWLQDWVGNRVAPWGIALWWSWNWDEKLYPNWKNFVSSMKEQNVRVLTYINTYVGDMSSKEIPVNRDLYTELVSKDLAVKDTNGDVVLQYMKAAMFDLSNPDTITWVKNVIRDQILAGGVSGYMCDYGEALPLDASLCNADAKEFHNRYPEVWAQANYEVVRELGLQDEIVYFMRAGFLQSPRHTSLFWLGDQIQSWDKYDGLKSAVFAATMGGFSGISITHADIGGYNCLSYDYIPLKYIRSKELFIRGCEFGAMSPVYRTHDGTNKGKAWQLYSDDETISYFGRMAKLYVAWKFYRLELLKAATESGYPVIRHMYLQFNDEEEADVIQNLKYQYMLGTELLVSLAVDQGATTVTTYLPKSTIPWVNLWNKKIRTGEIGGYVTDGAPLGYPVIYYPENSSVGKQFAQNVEELLLL